MLYDNINLNKETKNTRETEHNTTVFKHRWALCWRLFWQKMLHTKPSICWWPFKSLICSLVLSANHMIESQSLPWLSQAYWVLSYIWLWKWSQQKNDYNEWDYSGELRNYKRNWNQNHVLKKTYNASQFREVAHRNSESELNRSHCTIHHHIKHIHFWLSEIDWKQIWHTVIRSKKRIWLK